MGGELHAGPRQRANLLPQRTRRFVLRRCTLKPCAATNRKALDRKNGTEWQTNGAQKGNRPVIQRSNSEAAIGERMTRGEL